VYPDATASSGSMGNMSGASAISFLVPLLAGISLLTFALTLTISLSPTEAEIHEDALLRHRMDTEFAGGLAVQPAARIAPPAVTSDAFTRGGYAQAPSSGYGQGGGRTQAGGYANGGAAANGGFGPGGQASQAGDDQPAQAPQPLPTRTPRGGGHSPGQLPPRA
jgi:hypothetical protein